MPVANKVNNDGKYQPSFFLTQGKFAHEHIHMLNGFAMRIVDPWAASKLCPTQLRVDRTMDLLALLKKVGRRTLPTRLRQILRTHARRQLIPRILRQIVERVTHYKLLARKARALLQRESVAAVVLMGDRHLGWETAIVKAANQLGIPSMIVPVALSGPEGPAQSRIKIRMPISAMVCKRSLIAWLERFSHAGCMNTGGDVSYFILFPRLSQAG